MGGFTASDLKNVLYLFPVLSALICFVCVKALRKSAARAVANSGAEDDNPDDEGAKWRKLDLFGNDPHAAKKGPFGIGGGSDQEMLPVHEKHVGLVIEYNEAGLEAHARKAKISQKTHAQRSQRTRQMSVATTRLTTVHSLMLSCCCRCSFLFLRLLVVFSLRSAGNVTSMKKTIADTLVRGGLRAVTNRRPNLSVAASSSAGASPSVGGSSEFPKSKLMFTGSMDRMKRAIWTLREEMGWVRSIPGLDDVATAYVVQQIGKGLKLKIKFEPCPILFNQE